MRWLAVLLLAFQPSIARADMATVLGLCLDTELSPEDRISELTLKGWAPNSATELEALTMAITVARINAGDPTNWNADRATATAHAVQALKSQNVQFLLGPDRQGVFIGRNRVGLQTCLYVGQAPNLAALDDVLDGAFVRRIDHVSRIRGDGNKSLISAHAISDEGRALFQPPLAYGMTFSVQLDRQPGDSD